MMLAKQLFLISTKKLGWETLVKLIKQEDH